MAELIIATIVVSLLGVLAYARASALRIGYELFRRTLLSFFGERGSYDDFESFLSLYKADLKKDKLGRRKATVKAWMRFVEAIRIAQNGNGKTKFEASDKALEKLTEDLRLAFPSMARWPYITPIVMSAVGVCGACLILLLTALQAAPWQTALVYVCLTVCAGVAGMLLLKVYEQYTVERVEKRIRIVANHLRRHLLMRTEKDYLLETGRAIQDELAEFKRTTSLLNLRVKRLADEQLTAEAVAAHVKVDLDPVSSQFAEFADQLKLSLQDHRVLQGQHVAQMRDTLVEFFDHESSQLTANATATKNVESLLVQLGSNLGRDLSSKNAAIAQLDQKLSLLIDQQKDAVNAQAIKEQLDQLTAKIGNHLKTAHEEMRSLVGKPITVPVMPAVEPSARVLSLVPKKIATSERPVDGAVVDLVQSVLDLLESASRSCALVVEQKRYFEKTLRSIDTLGGEQLERFRAHSPEFAESLHKCLAPLAAWQQHIGSFKPVTGRIAAEAAQEITVLLDQMHDSLARPELNRLWLNAEELRLLMTAGEDLNGQLGEIVQVMLGLQKRLLQAKESLLFLSTVGRDQTESVGAGILADLTKQLRGSLRKRSLIRFSVNHYAKEFVPKVRAIKSLVKTSLEVMEPTSSQSPRKFKQGYTKAS